MYQRDKNYSIPTNGAGDSKHCCIHVTDYLVASYKHDANEQWNAFQLEVYTSHPEGRLGLFYLLRVKRHTKSANNHVLDPPSITQFVKIYTESIDN